MELVEKGQSANLDETFNQLLVTLKWQGAKDFDLGALLEMKNGNNEFIYFNNKGDLNGPLYVQLDKDAGVGDTVDDGGNKETMKIMSLELHNKIHIVLWDYGAVQSGATARFSDDSVSASIMDDKGVSHNVNIPVNMNEEMGNCCAIATIDNTSPMGPKFVNQSIIGTAKKFGDVKNFLDQVVRETSQ